MIKMILIMTKKEGQKKIIIKIEFVRNPIIKEKEITEDKIIQDVMEDTDGTDWLQWIIY